MGMNPKGLIFVPLIGYGFAWYGHYMYETNTPLTFEEPWYSFQADLYMVKRIIFREESF